MPNRILHIGCSHLACTYTKNDKFESNKTYSRQLWELYDKEYSVVTIPSPSQGIDKFASVVRYMEENDYLRFFSHCILQLTSEPRKVFLDPNLETKQYENIRQLIIGADMYQDGYKHIVEGGNTLFSNNTRFTYERYENKFKKNVAGFLGLGRKTADFRNEWLDTSTSITESIDKSRVEADNLVIKYEYIKHTLEKNKVKFGVFDWWGQEHFERLLMNEKYWKDEYLLPDYKCLREIMEEDGTWDLGMQSGLGHMNAEHISKVSKLLKRGMDDKEFL